jgi:beta-glucosidase-like glycosyl hydrolase/uncharacterized protein YbbC (DUF1343 family)/CubicO group peptidase (beta-lactamase class C family)
LSGRDSLSNNSFFRRSLWRLSAAAIVLAVAACSSSRPAAGTAAQDTAMRATAEATWVRETLASLDLAGKAAQMVMVRASAVPMHPESPEYRELAAQVRDERVGGIVLFASALDTMPGLLDELQRLAEVPLLVAADLERSLGFRAKDGPVALPSAMAIGATRSVDAARFAGELTAREGRAAGIHWALAPVADVNNNPANPVINMRSFGEDPELVSRLVAAWIEGARAGGIMTSVKHFPGHGDTATDSHLALPTIPGDRARLDRVELAPFRAAIAAGADSVMLGHLAVPALDPSGRPATLSRAITTGVLRDELGFGGLAVTDAMEMKGVGDVWMGDAVIEAVAAGADVVLLPADPRVAVQSLARAVREGQLPEARIDEAAARVLAAKAKLGLMARRPADRAALRRDVGRPEDAARATAIAAQAVTLLRNRGDIVPLAAEQRLDVLHLVLSSDWVNANIDAGDTMPGRELARRGAAVTTRRVGPQLPPTVADELVAAAAGRTHVVVSAFVRVTSSKGRADMDVSHAELIRRLVDAGVPVIVVSYGSPYLLSQFPDVPAYLCAYGADETSQRAAIAALFGERPIGGVLPVTIPGVAALGDGIELPRRPLALAAAAAVEAGFTATGLAEVDRVVEQAVADRAFPGAVVAIGHRGRLAHLKGYGRHSYEAGAAAMATDTIFDLASLTKVVATTTVAMTLVDEGRLDLDARVDSFLPRFVGPNKDRVTVRHLLTHSAGIDWWAPLYKDTSGLPAYVQRICAMPLVSEPGTVTKYSDLGIILLGEILERAAGKPLETLVRERVTVPLGMCDTLYRPGPELLSRIPPTEVDAWRGCLVHGEVHDENAFAIGGAAPHAGLFSTAPDLARFAQMLLWSGVYDHRRVVSRRTVDAFTRRSTLPPGTDRALGWDTRSAKGSSAGTLFSPTSFGHTGFTGTSLWIDPERELFVILLTNRVHPTRENNAIRKVRPALADAVVRALADPDEHPAPVLVGLDRVATGEAPELAGKRLGLLTHAAAVALDGRRSVEVLRERGLDLVRLYAPEHGLAARAAAGEAVADGRDATTGLPVVSVYGTEPAPADFAGIDALVVDLQDTGVRFYTYTATLLRCLRAAAEADAEVVVLDRPNPLGGEYVAGPARAPLSEVPATLVSETPGPLVHGLTIGEMARHANSILPRPARLSVVAMRGWQRSMRWQDTGRRWLPPSPNLRTAEAALAYPGTCLLEATNATEGRGTDAPFLLLGAPWADPAALPAAAPGFALTPARFTPRGSPAAPSPKHVGVECAGVRVAVTDTAAADPYRLGVELLAALAKQQGFAWQRDGAALTWLVGTARLGERLAAGMTPDAIVAADAPDLAAWRDARLPALLYPEPESAP